MSTVRLTKAYTRAQLQRLKWGIIVVPSLLLVLYETYNLLVIGIQWHQVVLRMLVVMGSSFALVQFSFAIILRLHDHSARQQKHLEVLHQVDTELSGSQSQSQVLEAVLKGALNLMSARGARVLVYDPEQQEFSGGWERVTSGECYPIDYHPRPGGFNARVAQTGEPLVVGDTATRPAFFSVEDLARGVRAAVGVPLLHSDRVLGVLSVGFDAPRVFADGELEVLLVQATWLDGRKPRTPGRVSELFSEGAGCGVPYSGCGSVGHRETPLWAR